MSHDEHRPQGLDRRSFLQILGVAFGSAILPEALTACGADAEVFTVSDIEALTVTSRVSVIRPEDLVVLSLGFVNLRRTAARQLARIAAGPAFILVDFPPQAIVEDAVALGSSISPGFIAGAKLGGTTRLVFQLPDAFTSDAYTLTSILALCGRSSLVVTQAMQNTAASTVAAPPALPSGGGTVVDRSIARAMAHVDPAASARTMAFAGALPALAPYSGGSGQPQGLSDRSVSQIEIPYRLQMSPNSMAGWSHAAAPVQGSSGRFEVWHTVLGVRDAAGNVDERNAYLRTARALWTRDTDLAAQDGSAQPVVLPSLQPSQRQRIVALSSQGANAPPIQINRLMLSSLGGYLDARGDWTDPTQIVNRWMHRITGGREQFVEVDQGGFLLPFGNLATRVQLTKRNEDPNQGPVGTLFAWDVIIVRNPVVSYRDADMAQQATRDRLRQLPFVAVELKQTQFICQRMAVTTPTWAVDLSGTPIMVPAVGYDRRGRAIHFSVPLYFVPGSASTGALTGLVAYNAALKAPPGGRPSIFAAGYGGALLPMAGQRVAYAPSAKDDTTFATRALSLDLVQVAEAFPLAPVVTSATIDVEALHTYTSGAPVVVRYHSTYASVGLDEAANRSQLLFKLDTPSSVSADFTNRPDGGTGFVAPNITFTALSRTNGPAYDGTVHATLALHALATSTGFTDGAFDPATYFGQAGSALDKLRIFGVFALTDIIRAIDPSEIEGDMNGLSGAVTKTALRYAPKFVAEGLTALEKLVSTLVDLRAQVETLFTNAQELLQSAEGATKIAADQLATAKAKTAAVVAAAKTFYATLLYALDTLERHDLSHFAGIPAPTDGKPFAISAIATDGNALLAAVDDLASFGARATVKATAAVGVDSGPVAAAPLRIVQGVRDVFHSKLQTLLDLVADANKVVKTIEDVEQAIAMARDMTVRMEWQPKIQSWPSASLPLFRPASQHGLTLTVEARAKATDKKPAGVDVTCRLDHFDFCLGSPDADGNPIVGLHFDHISFAMTAGKKPDVDVVFNGITFGGPLAFLETLRKILPLDGFSDPPYLDIDINGVHAGFSLSVPNVAVGMFSLENIAISAKLEIPFFTDGGPAKALTFTFAFCDKDHPFLVTVSLLGGGGYFVMSITPKGLESLEASICVGAQLAIDLLGIAHGSVSIMAGITFTVQEGDVSITAFLRLHGELDVLGVITISVDLRISMTYDFTTKTLIAEARLHVEVSILLFSICVDLPFRKEFHSCNNDPTLRELMPPQASNVPGQFWADYCNAYA